jgi:hypothetical protein
MDFLGMGSTTAAEARSTSLHTFLPDKPLTYHNVPAYITTLLVDARLSCFNAAFHLISLISIHLALCSHFFCPPY